MNRFRIRSNASLAVLAATFALGHAASARAASNLSVSDTAVTVGGAEGADDAAAADETAAEDTAGNSGLTEIVVTATKRETNLQRTPISISVMGAEMIRERKVQSLLDLGDGSIPSLRVATYESRQTALTVGIRGIVPGDANQPAREPGVGVYIDGIYLARQHGLNAALFEVDRIEVLKGPQGTLFGRNTEGGAVSLISKAPTGEFGGRMNVGIGNLGGYSGGLHLNLPEVARFSLKVDTVISHQDPTVKNPLQGQAGWNQYHRYGGRVAARWKPMDGFTADFAFDISRDENTPFYSQLINFNPDVLPVATLAQIVGNTPANTLPAGMIAPLPSMVVVTGERMDVADIGVPQQVSLGKTKGFSSNLRWKVADGLELRSITAWRTVDSEQWDNSGGAHRSPSFLPNGSFSRYSLSFLNARQFSQEFQAVGSVGAIDYVAGLYYFNERAEEIAATPNTNTWNATGTGYTIRDAMTWQRSALSISRASYANSKSYAAFGQVTWNPTERLHLTLGGRYTHDQKSGDLYRVNNAASAFPFAFKYNRFDPMAVLAWDASENINLYAKYSTGYRAGGASSRSISYATFGPESVKAYEVGAKTEFFDRRLRFNLAGYIMDRFDSQFDFDFYQVQTNGSVRHTLETVNAAGVTKIRGLEADLTVRPVDGLSMGLSFSYTYWKVPPTPNPLVAGNPLQPLYLVYTPPHAFSGNLDYTLPLSGDNDMAMKFHIDANYSDPHHSFDNEAVLVDKSFLVNARLAVADIPMSSGGQKLTVALWSRNVFNEAHIYRRSNANRQPIDGNYRTVVGDYANFNAPRTFGIEATLSF